MIKIPLEAVLFKNRLPRLLTPVGICLLSGASIVKVSVGQAVYDVFPFLLTCLVALMLVTLIPQITLFLPSLLNLRLLNGAQGFYDY